MALSQVADDYDYPNGKRLGNGWVNMKSFHQQAQQEIIENQIEKTNQKIAEQLNSSPDVGFGKNDKLHE